MKAAARMPIAARVKAAARTKAMARARMKIRIANARGEKKRKFPKRKSLNFACRSCHAGQERHAFISFLLTFLSFFPGPSGRTKTRKIAITAHFGSSSGNAILVILSRLPYPAYEGSENGMLIFLFFSPFSDSSRACYYSRVRMTKKACLFLRSELSAIIKTISF